MEKVVVYFDYICPFAKRGMELAEIVKDTLELSFDWKHYSLRQGNYQGKEDWQIWQDSIGEIEHDETGLLCFLASYAARLQNDPFENFRLKLIKYRHESKQATTLASILGLVEEAGLNTQQFEQDVRSQEARVQLAQEHQEAAGKDISATPTFCFESGAAAYFRFLELPESKEDSIRFFLDYKHIIEAYPQLQTIRRPYKRN